VPLILIERVQLQIHIAAGLGSPIHKNIRNPADLHLKVIGLPCLGLEQVEFGIALDESAVELPVDADMMIAGRNCVFCTSRYTGG
jgi:hypothetical protein